MATRTGKHDVHNRLPKRDWSNEGLVSEMSRELRSVQVAATVSWKEQIGCRGMIVAPQVTGVPVMPC